MDSKEDAVFDLLTELCTKTAVKYTSNIRLSQKKLVTKMRSRSYEIILKKSSEEIPQSTRDPISDMLCYYFVNHQNSKNIGEYKRLVDLKKIISVLRCKCFGDHQDDIKSVLKLLVGLSDTAKEDISSKLYQSPFSYGVLDKMLPKPPIQAFGSPQPYSYYPSQVFELPYSLRCQANNLEKGQSQTYTEYTVQSFDSKSLLADINSPKPQSSEVKTFLSPISLVSMTSTHLSPYSETMFNYPRLTGPRDLNIPGSSEVNVKVSFQSTTTKSYMREMYRATNDDGMVDIWELATQVDKDIPEDIWEIVAKLPPLNERQLIASSPREMRLWRLLHEDVMSELHIISEKQFIRHVMYLIIGIETSSFPFNEEWNCFTMKDNLVLEAISRDKLRGYVSELLTIGTYYRRLYRFAFNQITDDHFHTRGLVYEAAREVIRRYLLEFRLLATEIYEQCNKSSIDDANCIPTLLQILHHVDARKYEIETIASIYKMADTETNTLPQGAELMSYLFNEIYLVTHKRTAFTMFTSLLSLCKVYFKFIERFIFEGELDDNFNEFFIRKDSQYINSRTKRYWDKGFHITQSVAIPDFLRALAKCILLCGKSLRLLKMCNPSDPLLLLISSDHPSISCCVSFEALSRQQQLLDVYRTRCLFVSGEPASFQQIMLKREAERKAFTEMATLKQAETMDKIVAERKRLAQLIIAEKQHSLRVLEAAMAETKAAKSRSKRREKIRSDLEKAADAVSDQIDAKLRDDEKNKIMEYYSKLNIEVEKSKIHTEWKIKRLQLDESRIQLLSTEERNLKREKLELEHQKNEECMAMSIQSIDHDDENEARDISNPTSEVELNVTDLNEIQDNPPVVQSHTVFSAICNAARSIFGVSNSDDKCDNKKKLDSQGNVVEIQSTSSADIGKNLNEAYDNLQFLKMRQEALVNKQKVMAHEFGQIDKENNQMKDPSMTSIVDEENNFQDWSPFAQARRNKLKVLGDEFGLPVTEVTKAEPITDAQKEALVNKQKILGVEYNLPAEVMVRNDPANVAQEEAVRNKIKVLGSEYGSVESPRRDAKKNLTLNLKPYGECSSQSLGVTPSTGAVTPGDIFPRLDLETPTTAEIHLEGPMTSDIFSPQSETKEMESLKTIDKEYISTDGFAFPIIDDETIDSEVPSDVQIQSPENSPSKTTEATFRRQLSKNYSVFDLLDSSYDLADFDPFGVKHWDKYSKDYFNKKMDTEMAFSCYTHPAVIMEEVKKSPYSNIFAHICVEEKDESITCDNIATLTACLQRSVMLPLTYQLEVVNNSILSYFLVNLDMYEHLRCLKDYFFLMDGEFSRSICHNLFSKLSKTLNPHELLNFATLHNILDKALGSSISHLHKFSEKLSFMMSEPPLSLQHSSPDALSCLSLTYAVKWPLNIILSNEALLRYARVFQFLLKMRRIFWVLGEDFQLLKQASKQFSRKLLRSPQYRSIQIYRHTMASLIRALDNYIVTTCILTSWVEFENDLKKARTLDDLYDCHVVYIKKVLFRCLLNNRSTPVMKLLNDIFTVILKFSRVLKAGEWNQKEPNGHFTHSNFNQLQELFHLFEKLAKVVHKVVTRLMECGYQRHLVELLTMINLNGYYDPEKSKEEHNTSAKEKSINVSGFNG
ncbi:gamma-tubulin complex component 6 [Plodia interpunctella]|uniref:gamma-tubulin complex component 6 n=1 Tax=Plodia interpunctella TaxID=58824 RepID=UPI0023684D7D|nr:gamma-tubulin complex component 6 [Plodia interpunctella]